MSTSNSPIVLVTGATGHLAFRVVAQALQAGFRVRATTRKIGQASQITSPASVQPYIHNLEVVEVPDILAPNAFDAVLKDVSFIEHVASPIPNESLQGTVQKIYYDPAVNGTLNILEGALKTPSVKRVIITSSVAVVEPNPNKPSDAAIGPDDIAPVPDYNESPDNMWVSYRNSKRLAYAAAQSWMTKQKASHGGKLHFDLIHILPTYIQGWHEPATTVEALSGGSRDVMADLILYGKTQIQFPRVSPLVHVDDAAAVHVAALDTTKGEDGGDYIASYPGRIHWNEINEVVQRKYPGLVERGLVKVSGDVLSKADLYDSATATEAFRVEFRGLEEMVESFVGQYLRIVGEGEKKKA